MGVRRVVTGHTPEGKSVFVSDSIIDPVMERFIHIWGADEIPALPNNGSQLPCGQFFPPVGGFRFTLFTVAPLSKVPRNNVDLKGMLKEYDEKLPGLLKHMEKDHPGMHTSDTVDFEYIISGEVWLELDDGKEVLLRAGDTVVQNGTRHAWRNKGSEPCQMVVCLIGAHRK